MAKKEKRDAQGRIERRVEMERMSDEEMWKRSLGPYVALYGKSIEYIDEHFGREEAIKWIYKMEEDYRIEHKAMDLSVSNFLSRYTPGRALRDKVAMKIFSMKLQRTFHEYQFLYNRGEHHTYELLDEKGRVVGGRVDFPVCPYVAAMQDIPEEVRCKRETLCELDCNGPFHDQFCDFIGFRIRMDPQPKGCVWHFDPPTEALPDD